MKYLCCEIYRVFLFAATTNYNQLPLSENSDEDWNDDVKNDLTSSHVTSLNAHEEVIRDTDALLNSKKSYSNGHGTAYEFSHSRNRKYGSSFCSPTRATIALGAGILVFGIGYIIGYVTPTVKEYVFGPTGSAGTPSVALKKRSGNWRTKMPDWGRYIVEC